MIAFGVGEILGCFFIGWVVDKFGSKRASWVNVGICLVMTVVTVAFLAVNEYNYLAYIMAFMWGIEDSATNTHCQEMLGFEFDNNSEPFSVYNGCQALSCVVFQFIEVAISTHTAYMIYSIVCGVIAMVCCGCTAFFEFRGRHSAGSSHTSNSRDSKDVRGLLEVGSNSTF